MGRKREFYIKVRFTRDELDQLNSRVRSTGLSREAYMRKLVNNVRPIVMPSDEMVEVISELRRIGTNINQIAHRANMNEAVDSDSYRENFNLLQDQIDRIMMAINSAKAD